MLHFPTIWNFQNYFCPLYEQQKYQVVVRAVIIASGGVTPCCLVLVIDEDGSNVEWWLAGGGGWKKFRERFATIPLRSSWISHECSLGWTQGFTLDAFITWLQQKQLKTNQKVYSRTASCRMLGKKRITFTFAKSLNNYDMINIC